ncbi:MAG: endonuclease/exonuclease/phosphatase family protein [bacterium]|nr:endonuclease/exonuclease/phosphatase family protein [bacterium]
MRLVPILAAAGMAIFVSVPAWPKAIEAVPDGIFDEWDGAKLAKNDPSGDGAASGLDLGRLWVGDDGEALYLRLEVGRETILQNPPSGDIGNDLRLYLDLDRKKSTGFPVENLGADLEIRFGLRSVLRYDGAGNQESVAPGTGVVMGLPTHSSDEFEIRVELPESLRPGSARAPKAKRKRIKLVLRDVAGGDRLPNGGAVKYKLVKNAVAPPEAIDFGRAPASGVVRILSMNVEASTPAIRPDVYRRLLEAVQPDIVAFQELTTWNAEQARDFVESVLSPEGDIAWHARQQFDCVTVSKFPILNWAPIDDNLLTHIDLPQERDLVLFNMHPPCCDNEDGRDAEFDNLAAAWRDLLQGSFSFAIGDGDAAVFAGDYNLVGFRRQLESIRDGVFVGSSKGADFAPGRGEGSLLDPPLRHTHRRMAYTWRQAGSSFAPGRLDLVIFTGDALTLEKGFVVDTGSMPSKARKKLGLNRRDSELASDHLGLVTDFSVRDMD